MQDIKYCQRCGKVISDLNDERTNYYKHIALKYCEDCSAIITRQKTSARGKAYYRRNRKLINLQDEKMRLLSEENELLRQKIIELREQINY